MAGAALAMLLGLCLAALGSNTGAITAGISIPEALARAEAELARAETAGVTQDPVQLVPLLERTASLMRAMRRHDDAYRAHSRLLEIRGSMGVTQARLLVTFTELITDSYLAGRHSRALAILAHARQKLGSLPSEADRLLHRLEALVCYCRGDVSEAIKSMYIGLPDWTSPMTAATTVFGLHPTGGSRDQSGEVIRLLTYLLADGNTRSESQTRVDELKRSLVIVGPWQHPMQLPVHYIPDLTSQPWHTVQDWPHLSPVVKLLEAKTNELLGEYMSLKEAGRLLDDQDCLQGGRDTSRGAWRRFEVLGIWSELGLNGCSIHTPVSCQILSILEDMDVIHVLRLGFSALTPEARLRPHYGTTNTQLKLHLGLKVPKGREGRPCASMRVGAGPRRPWSQGQVLLFDDSYEHEVSNRCASERVVFQVVIRHPGLKNEKSDTCPTDQGDTDKNGASCEPRFHRSLVMDAH